MVAIVSVTREIPARAQAIFDLLARPARHALIDGSGSVRGVRPHGPARLFGGARFGMEMRMGIRYKILNQVVEFEEGRRIAWRHFGGHIWRYTLVPIDDVSTRVTEEFDPTAARSPNTLRLLGFNRRNRAAIEATLDRMVVLARSGAV
jgi:Polyketide cyclase / dehydrase and lipid transport